MEKIFSLPFFFQNQRKEILQNCAVEEALVFNGVFGPQEVMHNPLPRLNCLYYHREKQQKQ
jgi:hypothetical protein